MGAAQDVIRSIAAEETTVREAVDAAIGRIEAGDAEVNAVVVRDFDRARLRADALDRARAGGRTGALLGLPMTVKESYDVAGLPTTWGFEEHRSFVAGRDARVVERLQAAGAVILGKTNVPPGLVDFQSSNPVYGATHNPRGHGRSSGGSSGGSAASVAAGFVTAEMGSDVGGSIRIPAAFCGVWGLKPTFDLVPRDGHSMPGTDGAHDLLSVAGPLAGSPEDLDLLLGVVANHPLPEPTRRDLRGLRVAVMAEHPHAPVAADVAATLRATADRLADAGAVVDDAPDLPDRAALGDLYLRMLTTVLSARMPDPDVEPIDVLTWFALLDDHARHRRRWEAFLGGEGAADVVLSPVFSRTAFPLDDAEVTTRVLDVDGRATPAHTQLAWAALATMTGMPAVALPAGDGTDGLPIGLQLVGPRFTDRDLLRIAALLGARR